MAKCSECGFLAVWGLKDQKFQEATEWFRVRGVPEHEIPNRAAYQAKCFIRQHDLTKEVPQSPGRGTEYVQGTLSAIARDRDCPSVYPWMQGFHPKEHKEMLLNEAMLASQRAHERNSLAVAQNSLRLANRNFWVAVIAVGLSSVLGITGSCIAYKAAGIGAEATIEAVKMQIESDKRLADKK